MRQLVVGLAPVVACLLPLTTNTVLFREHDHIIIKFAELLDPTAHGHSGDPVEATAKSLRQLGSLASTVAFTQLRSDIEPHCERMAFVLNDGLVSTRPQTLRTDLIDVATWFPEGDAEPAWADLVRTRRFHLLTDGSAYVRAFLPGFDAGKAYDQAYPVLRYALQWIDDATPARAGLDVDVYAYSLNFALTAFDLVLDSSTHRFENIGNVSGGQRSLDFDKLNHFFASGLSLEGAIIDKDGHLVLLGKQANRAPTLDGIPVSLSDFAVAYRAVAHSGDTKPYMSLDPSSNQAVAQVNYGGRLQDTLVGSVTLRCDVRFKTVASGFDATTGDQLDDSIRHTIPDFLTVNQRYVRTAGWDNITSESSRFWFYPDSVELIANEYGVLIDRARFTAGAERSEAADQYGNAVRTATSPWIAAAIEHFNANYDKFAAVFEEVAELDNVARLLAVATWAHEMVRAGRLRSDLDSLMNVELPACRTPRSRPQLLVALLFDKRQTPPNVRSIDMSHLTIAESAESESVLGTIFKDSDPDRIMNAAATNAVAYLNEQKQRGKLTEPTDVSMPGSNLTGGLDLDLLPRLKSASRAEGEAADVLHAARSANRSGAPLGRAGLVSTHTLDAAAPPPPRPRIPRRIERDRTGEPVQWTCGDTTTKVDSRGGVEVIVRADRTSELTRAVTTRSESLPTLERSIYLDEHSIPAEFSIRDGSRNVRYRLRKEDGAVSAHRIAQRAEPTEQEIVVIETVMKASRRAADAWRRLDASSQVAAISKTIDGEVIIAWKRPRGYAGIRLTKIGERLSLSDAALMRALAEDAGAKAAAYSSDKIKLTSVSTVGDEVVIQVAGAHVLRVPVKEFKKFVNRGGAMPAALRALAELSRSRGEELVLMRHAFESKPLRFGTNAFGGETVRLAARLEREVPGLKVSTDDPSPEVAQRAASRRDVQSAAEIGYVMLRDAPGIEDRGLFDAIEKDLAALTPIREPADAAKVSDVLVIAGHNNRALFERLEMLGRYQSNGRSVLYGKTVLLLTCFEPGNPNMYSEFIERFGCRIVAPAERIDSVILRPVMKAFVDEARALSPQNPSNPLQLLKRAAQKGLEDAMPRERAGFEAIQSLIEQLSRAIPTEWPSDASTHPGGGYAYAV